MSVCLRKSGVDCRSYSVKKIQRVTAEKYKFHTFRSDYQPQQC